MQASLRRSVRSILGVLIALGLGTATAQAYTISPTGAITATSNGKITLRSTLLTQQCNWRLEGSITSGSAVAGDQIGSISGAALTNCLGGIAMITLTAAPWPIRLTAVLGSGPYTGAVARFENIGFQVSSPACLYGGTLGVLVAQASGGSSTVSLSANALTSSCGTASLSGSFTLTPGITVS